MARAKKRTRTRDELVALYNEQWGFLRRSARLFDAGQIAEAKALATTMRLLLHNTTHSHALLSQIGLDEALFFDTAIDGLVHVEMTGNGARYAAPLDGPVRRPAWLIPFKYWWRKVVIAVPGEIALTRADLVLTMADQDGGAHVDPEVDEAYWRIGNGRDVNWAVHTEIGLVPLVNLEQSSVRQIAHEAMVSLIRPRRVIPNDLPPGSPRAITQITTDATTGAVTRQEVQAKRVCPCRSGLPYAGCHGRGGVNEGKVTTPLTT